MSVQIFYLPPLKGTGSAGRNFDTTLTAQRAAKFWPTLPVQKKKKNRYPQTVTIGMVGTIYV
jgi:hypothetical protein